MYVTIIKRLYIHIYTCIDFPLFLRAEFSCRVANRMKKETGHSFLLLYHLRGCARPTSLKRDEDVISVAP